LTFNTPLTLLRIEPTLSAVPGQTHPGTVSLTVFSAAKAVREDIERRSKIPSRIIPKDFIFFI